VAYGDEITLPTDLTRQGYVFDGWYVEGTDIKVESNSVWSFEQDTTLVARWIGNTYTVTYEDAAVAMKDIVVTLDHKYSGVKETVMVKNGQILEYPEPPRRSDYAFSGWYTDSSCTNPYNFTGTITADITLYAKWTYMLVSCKSVGYVDIADHTTEANQQEIKITSTSSSMSDNRLFTCYKSGTYTINVKHITGDFHVSVQNMTKSSSIMSNTNLYSSKSKSATFSASAGDVIVIKFYNYTGTTSSTASFYVEGAEYPTSTATAVSSVPDGYMYKDGQEIIKTVKCGESTSLLEIEREGYTFLGWFDGETQVENGKWNIARDVTLVAKWQENP
jgi:uncharacterized repeat protein (TIGR02543 family)